MDRILIGALEDTIGYFSLTQIYDLTKSANLNLYAYPFGLNHSIFNYSEPVLFILLFNLAKYFHPVTVYNSIIIGTALLNIFATYKLLSLFVNNKKISAALSLLSVLNPYFLYHYRSHPQLIQTWMVTLYLYYLFKHKGTLLNFTKASLKQVGLLGVSLGFIMLTSNYLGFFLSLFLLAYSLTEILITKSRKLFQAYTTIFLVAGFTALIWLIPFFTSNYQTKEATDPRYIYRPIEDFVIFSAKPWYYLIPSVDNPFFGTYSKQVIETLQSKWGYYLTQNYFKQEHSTSYIGVIGAFFILVGLYKMFGEKKLSFLPIMTGMVFLYLLSLPPFITFNNHTIYLPSYALYKLFPMLRILTRTIGILNILNLVFLAIGFNVLFSKGNKVTKALLCWAVLLLFCELYIPLKLTIIGTPPEIYTELRKDNDERAAVVTYPYSYANLTYFWIPEHQKPVINIRDFSTGTFDSEEFTHKLITTESQQEACKLGAKYLLLFNDSDKLNYFESSSYLEKVGFFNRNQIEFPKSRLLLIESPTNVHSSILYKFVEGKQC